MKNMKVKVKLIVSFLIVAVFAAIVGAFGIIGMSSINNADDTMYNENVLAIYAMGEIRESLQRIRVGLRNYAIYAEDADALSTQKATMDVVMSNMDDLFEQYEATITDTSIEAAYFEAKDLYLNEFVPIVQQAYTVSQVSMQGARDLIFSDSVVKSTDSMVSAFTTSMVNNGKWAEDAVNGNTALFTRMTIIEIAVLIIAVAVAMFLAIYISGLISKPLLVLTGFMKKAASNGDITLRPEDMELISKYSHIKDETGQCIDSTSNFIKHITKIADELGSVAGGDLTTNIDVLSEQDVMGVAMRKMVDNLNNMFSEINVSTAQVSTGSRQIADGAQSLAQGSTEQAAAVQQLSSSISEIAEKTKINADMALRAATLANTIKGSAEKGSQQMDQMMDAVKEINQASQSINKVIKVIDDIAFQTNILALNAAVEAARAGQHGKGFAVVAEEVRNLAAKSAEAAKDTGGLIANSMEKAELGARIADETAASLAEIVSGIDESSQIVGDIAKSSEEQAVGISQVNKGIEQVAQVVQQNSATAEQSAAASEQMSGQSAMLEQLIAQFKLSKSNSQSWAIPSAVGHGRAPAHNFSHSDSQEYGKY